LAEGKVGRAEFLHRFGGIYEHSAWVAEEAYDEAAGDIDPGDRERLAQIFARCVDRADRERRLALIRSHPDLADRAAIAGGLSAASSQEQQSAGIDRCTPEEYERFQDLNRRYQQKFGFPFVMAVRGSNRREILTAFATRLKNDVETEFATAIKEIHKIAKLRLNADAN
jgi:OHCU decarboxylase